MSEAVSAIGGESFDGLVRVADAGLRGMIAVRGDLADADLKNAVTGLSGTDFPAQREITRVGERGLAWMSPDELLLMVPYAEAGAACRTLSDALAGQHHLAADVSDARAVFALEGAPWREVLAKLTPADLSPAAFGPGEIRRTRLAQAAAAFWMTGDDAVELVTFRSTARYVFELLSNAARPGSEVGHF